MSIPADRRTFLAATAAGVLGLSARGQVHAEQAATETAQPTSPPFSLGTVTYNIAAEWDLDTILRVLPKVGLTHVEFRTTHKHGVEPTLSKEQRQEIKKRCADAGVTIWGLGSVCEFHSPDPKVVDGHIETCKQFLQLAHDIGAKGVKVRPNGLRKDVPEAETIAQIGKALIPCGEAAANLGTEVWVEVHGSETSKPSRMKAIMEACGHKNVGICWNSNPSDVVDGSIKPSFEMLAPWIKSCHINALYSGYPYRELFSELRRINYDRVTLIELGEKLDPQNGELLLKYYRKLWQELCS
ncbi:MAG: TIM barrel protein [Planctomycetaceae bacterium]